MMMSWIMLEVRDLLSQQGVLQVLGIKSIPFHWTAVSRIAQNHIMNYHSSSEEDFHILQFRYSLLKRLLVTTVSEIPHIHSSEIQFSSSQDKPSAHLTI